MRSTPSIPEWIKNYRTPNYTNIWELIPNEMQLYGTSEKGTDRELSIESEIGPERGRRGYDRICSHSQARPY